MAEVIKVKEKKRVLVDTSGNKHSFHDVTELDLTGAYIRFHCRQGYILVNPDKVVFWTIDGKKVR